MAKRHPWFHEWFNSPYYHLLYDHRDEREAQDFIDRLLRYLHLPKGATALDLACGKGRHAAHLAQHALQVWGLDIAEESIEAARKQHRYPNLQFAVHDMRKPLPFPKEYFDAIFNLFTSFGYFETEEEHLKTLQNISTVLKPQGTFVLDFLNAEKIIRQLIPEDTVEKQGIQFHIRRWLDKAGYINKNIRFTEKETKKELEFTERVRAFRQKDLKSLLLQAHLQPVAWLGDYHLAPYEAAKSDRLIVISKKTTN